MASSSTSVVSPSIYGVLRASTDAEDAHMKARNHHISALKRHIDLVDEDNKKLTEHCTEAVATVRNYAKRMKRYLVTEETYIAFDAYSQVRKELKLILHTPTGRDNFKRTVLDPTHPRKHMAEVHC